MLETQEKVWCDAPAIMNTSVTSVFERGGECLGPRAAGLAESPVTAPIGHGLGVTEQHDGRRGRLGESG